MSSPLIAVDVGNNRIKLGRFDALPPTGLPEPAATLHVVGEEPQLERIDAWLAAAPRPLSWWIGSVNRPTAGRLLDWLRTHRPHEPVTLLACGDLPLRVEVPRPDMVGIDRLLDALAANRLRAPDRPAVVVDLGTAITVDLVSADGAFCGGAIAPGISSAARALHAFTDLLPLINVSELNAPPRAVGTSTIEAMQSGLFWGALGTVRELIRQFATAHPRPPQVFLTGGAAPAVVSLLEPDARHVPHLTLAGIALAADAPRLK